MWPLEASISGWKKATISPSSIAAAQRLLALEPADQLLLHRPVEQLDAVPATRLRAVERGVRVAQQLARRRAVQRRGGHADAHRRRHLATLGVHRLGEHADEAIRHGRSACHVEAGHHHDELVAAHATGDRAGLEAAQQAIGDDADEPVATAVTERVVDGLEPVEVAEQQTRPGARRSQSASTCSSSSSVPRRL